MRIGYIVPGIGLPEEEVKRRGEIANSIIGNTDVKVDVITVDEGPITIESAVEEAFAATSYLKHLPKLEGYYDAFVIGCFGDPGLRAARELVEKPVVGPAEASLHVASLLADDYIILSPLRTVIPMTKDLVRMYGFKDLVKDVISIEVPVIDIIQKRGDVINSIKNILEREIRDHKASGIILGCMSMGFALLDEILGKYFSIPIINPVKVSLKLAELLACLGLRHSKQTYPKPSLDKLRHLINL